ncbi:uncharacterized protein TRIVIDRAFT_60733 [Trichoderma virens Gv29-8]|uniref:Uncharacterized protein n=1 Tax=Hypocrea virens (strain Gv29-8 / FGSC 10586) TaxID=413071 RepID=G9MTQ5_HYPVG|nr:uncharacterized protein TRIVIDRAFT_60733 [Trichoderma virens Gv29-8]EHK22405.1 hypothetical protein TRIVIDRAFT_60733 [Trichoderma virens Gv29-8]UKZ47446.1 hypothetical protein TrVGV298_001664 [Trichoderma virens]
MIFKRQPLPEDPDIQSISCRFDIEKWPTLKLYLDLEAESLKPHQVADLGVIFDKLDTLADVFSKRVNGAHMLDKPDFERRMRILSPTNPDNTRTVAVTTSP